MAGFSVVTTGQKIFVSDTKRSFDRKLGLRFSKPCNVENCLYLILYLLKLVYSI